MHHRRAQRHLKNVTPADLPEEGDNIALKAEIFAAKANMKLIIDALGVKTANKSLGQIVAESIHAAKVAKMCFELGPATMAYIDAALDAMAYNTPDDTKRAVRILGKIKSDFSAGLAAVNGAEIKEGA